VNILRLVQKIKLILISLSQTINNAETTNAKRESFTVCYPEPRQSLDGYCKTMQKTCNKIRYHQITLTIEAMECFVPFVEQDRHEPQEL